MAHTSSNNNSSISRGQPFTYKFNRGRGGRRGFSRTPFASCQICGYSNHIAADCRRRFDHSFARGNDLRSTTHRPGRFSQPQAQLSILRPSPVSISEWYPDTGVSHHITPDLASLRNIEEYKGK